MSERTWTNRVELDTDDIYMKFGPAPPKGFKVFSYRVEIGEAKPDSTSTVSMALVVEYRGADDES